LSYEVHTAVRHSPAAQCAAPLWRLWQGRTACTRLGRLSPRRLRLQLAAQRCLRPPQPIHLRLAAAPPRDRMLNLVARAGIWRRRISVNAPPSIGGQVGAGCTVSWLSWASAPPSPLSAPPPRGLRGRQRLGTKAAPLPPPPPPPSALLPLPLRRSSFQSSSSFEAVRRRLYVVWACGGRAVCPRATACSVGWPERARPRSLSASMGGVQDRPWCTPVHARLHARAELGLDGRGLVQPLPAAAAAAAAGGRRPTRRRRGRWRLRVAPRSSQQRAGREGTQPTTACTRRVCGRWLCAAACSTP
jgi:hypothetical protein